MTDTQTVDWMDGRISDADVEHMRSLIGKREPLRGWVTAADHDAIWHFAQGVGDDNPLWWDTEQQAGSVWRRRPAPPTLLYTFMSGPRLPGETTIGGVEDLLPGVLGLWAGDAWVWRRPLWEGEPVLATSGLYAVQPKQTRFGGQAILQTDEIRFTERTTGDEIATLYRKRMRVERGAARNNGATDEYRTPAYTDEQIAEIERQYESEYANRRGGEPRFGDDVSVGDTLPPLVKGPLTVTGIVSWLLGWGSPLCPTNRMAHTYLAQHPGARLHNDETNISDTIEGAHWDRHFAQRSGLPDGYDFGGQRIAWLAHLLGDWAGDASVLRELDARLRRPNLLGDTTWVRGTVTGKQPGTHSDLVTCELSTTNQRGEVTATATAVVELPNRAAGVDGLVGLYQ
ncbi:MAG TPA: MaoC family dehydratase N-terminal domain-containing protein [Pseudonocardiaceae bacterium]|nr:MaoC family dehydratase N-terminal domain-containing protein [Pseudonocardiaceae bacterium]